MIVVEPRFVGHRRVAMIFSGDADDAIDEVIGDGQRGIGVTLCIGINTKESGEEENGVVKSGHSSMSPNKQRCIGLCAEPTLVNTYSSDFQRSNIRLIFLLRKVS
jgi:hypothetical protein